MKGKSLGLGCRGPQSREAGRVRGEWTEVTTEIREDEPCW